MYSGSKPAWETIGNNADRLRALWKTRLPTRTIAAQLDISISTLWKATKRLDLPRRATTYAEASAYQRRANA